MPNENTEIENAEQLGTLKSEVHTLNTLVAKLFDKLDSFIDKSQPKPLSFNTIIVGSLSVLSIFALLFGSVIYISNSSNAPILAQMQQTNINIQAIQSSAVQNTSLIQLTNQKLSGINNKVISNEDTLRWLLFDENIPKQLTQFEGKVNTLEMQMNLIMDQQHKNKRK